MYGTNITVRKASSWEDNQIEVDNAQDELEENIDEKGENTDGNVDIE